METSHIEDDVPALLDASLRTSPDEFGKAAARQRFRQWLPSATSALGSLSVRATLRLAFACVVTGAFAIGVFSLVQMGRLNQSTHTIFEKEYTA